MLIGHTLGYRDYEKEMLKLRDYGYGAFDFQGFVNTETELFIQHDRMFERSLMEMRRYADANGLIFSQTHGPWRYPPTDATESDRAERLEKMKKAIYGTAILGCPYMVVHPVMPFGVTEKQDNERFMEINRTFFARLTEIAAEYQVTVCLENMPFPQIPLTTPEQIADFVRALGSERLRVCLDTGHALVMHRQPADAVRDIGKDLLATLHIHDNDGKDHHRMPGCGCADWEAFSDALREVGYAGCLSLETEAPGSLPDALREEWERLLAHIARYIADRAK